jgi:hypothetical protein
VTLPTCLWIDALPPSLQSPACPAHAHAAGMRGNYGFLTLSYLGWVTTTLTSPPMCCVPFCHPWT